MMNTPHTGLLDGDIIAWKAACLADSSGCVGPDIARLLDGIVEDWCHRAGVEPKNSIVCLSTGRSFRYDLFPEYKAHRKDKERPQHLADCFKHLEGSYRCLRMNGLEADDLMGILMTNGKVKLPIIVTIDKDLTSVPGPHCNPDKEVLFDVSKDYAEYFFCLQWMTGDPSDGYKGIPGVGPKKAEKIIRDRDADITGYEAVFRAFESKGIPRDEALTQARLARILTADLWDSKGKHPILWTPPPPASCGTDSGGS